MESPPEGLSKMQLIAWKKKVARGAIPPSPPGSPQKQKPPQTQAAAPKLPVVERVAAPSLAPAKKPAAAEDAYPPPRKQATPLDAVPAAGAGPPPSPGKQTPPLDALPTTTVVSLDAAGTYVVFSQSTSDGSSGTPERTERTKETQSLALSLQPLSSAPPASSPQRLPPSSTPAAELVSPHRLTLLRLSELEYDKILREERCQSVHSAQEDAQSRIQEHVQKAAVAELELRWMLSRATATVAPRKLRPPWQSDGTSTSRVISVKRPPSTVKMGRRRAVVRSRRMIQEHESGTATAHIELKRSLSPRPTSSTASASNSSFFNARRSNISSTTRPTAAKRPTSATTPASDATSFSPIRSHSPSTSRTTAFSIASPARALRRPGSIASTI